jgi:hypothetical protein
VSGHRSVFILCPYRDLEAFKYCTWSRLSHRKLN